MPEFSLNITMKISKYKSGLINPHKKPANEFLYLKITFRLLKAYMRLIFCTLLNLLILCVRDNPFAAFNMKLYVNARFLTQPVSGVQRYGIECCRKIKKKYNECIFLTPANIYNTDIANELGATIVGTRTGHAWEQADLPRFLKKEGSPPLFNPCNTAPLFYNNNYITLHDLAFYHHPEWNSRLFAAWYNTLVPRIVRRSRHLFTVSNTMRLEIAAAYNVPLAAISITYNGISDAMMATGHSVVAKEKLILSVGSFNKRKNHHTLIKAFCGSSLKNEYKLVITGDKNKVFSETGIDERELERNNIVVLRNLSEQELINKYLQAEMVVSLSLYEGFGIPVLEGLFHGCKAVCSDIPVYKELYNDVAVFCNPQDTNAVIAAVSSAAATAAPDAAIVAALTHKYNYETAADVIINAMTAG